MRATAYVAGLIGLIVLAGLFLRADVPAFVQIWHQVGLTLFWLVPYRILFFALYAIGWRALIRPFDLLGRAGFVYVLWVTSVREAVDRLLPVASIGGGVVGVRLMRWRGLAAAPVGATIVVEILLTLFALYLFGALGVLILLGDSAAESHRTVLAVLVLSLPIPVGSLLLLRFGSVFERIQRFLQPLVGLVGAESAVELDAALRACLRRVGTLTTAGLLQFLALISASFEVWWAMRLFGHPIDAASAVMLEGLTQAVRHLAFIIPAGLGVQEAALVMFGHTLGISTELALAVSAVKRMREVACGIPPLLMWQVAAARRMRMVGAGRNAR